MFHFPLSHFAQEIEMTKSNRDEETAVVLTAAEDMVPMALLSAVHRTHVVPGRLILMTVQSLPIPKVKDEDVIEIRPYPSGCWGVTARYGFREVPDMCRFLALCNQKGLALDPQEVYFYLSRMTLVTTGKAELPAWRKALFAFLYHNARSASSYYCLPPDRVVELGSLVEL
jgi:KUP system potassium uptake protein